MLDEVCNGMEGIAGIPESYRGETVGWIKAAVSSAVSQLLGMIPGRCTCAGWLPGSEGCHCEAPESAGLPAGRPVLKPHAQGWRGFTR